MKYIEIDHELYKFLASKTERIGESASDILRRLLELPVEKVSDVSPKKISQPSLEKRTKSKPRIVEKKFKPLKNKPKVPFVTPLDGLLIDTNIHEQKGAVGRFLYVLEKLENIQGVAFQNVLNIQGRDRLYFARSKELLLEASKTSNPKEIGESGYWVITNNNTIKKRTILKSVLLQSGFPSDKATQLAELI